MSNIDDDPGGPSDRVNPDRTPPRNESIAFFTVLTVVSLFGVKFAADAYLESNTTEVRTAHIETSHAADELAAYHDEARESLEGGEVPIDDAMRQLAERGRAAFVQIRPTSDDSDAPRVGWTTLPAAPLARAPHATRTEFSLSPSEMPPEDAELDALESGVPLPRPAPRRPPAAPAP